MKNNYLLILAILLILGLLAVFFIQARDVNLGEAIDQPVNQPIDQGAGVVSSHYLATKAGQEVLEAGGRAADAAVAVATTLSVVEPWFSSALGGGTWALYYDAESEKVTSLDGVGPVGSLASIEDYEPLSEDNGVHQTIVPGAWDGWMLWLREYGNLDLRDVLAPAIRVAREGFPVSSQMEFWLGREEGIIRTQPQVMAIYGNNDSLVSEGDIVYQNDMAGTFEKLALAYDEALAETNNRNKAIERARDYFYRGPIAESIVDFSVENGGFLTIEDFNNFRAEIVEPISIDYDGLTVYQNPPNSQGISMLMALNILDNFDFSNLEVNDVEAIHAQVEAIKLAMADRYHHIGDPDRVNIPVSKLLDEEYAREQFARINMNEAMTWPIETGLEGEESHTTTFHIVDKWGNVASVTTSLGAQFLVAGDTGIHLNNRMRMISLEEGNPNQLTPGYKVRHTSNPYLVFKNNKPYISGGNTGVDTQPQGQTQQFISVVEFGLTAQEAISRPRFVSTAFPAGTVPNDIKNNLQMEADFSEEVIRGLREKGHNIAIGEGIYGSANMIVIGEDGKDLQIGAESRRPEASGVIILSK